MALMGSVAAASDRAALIAQIEAGGQNEFEDERHAVEVSDCQLTTYRWKQVEGEGWVLWTSFEFPMLSVGLNENPATPEIDYYVYAEMEPPAALVFFKAKEGTDFSHEKPFQRKPKGAYTASSRGDGTTHYIERKTEVFIMQQGPDVRAKAEMFTTGYIRYVQEYCTYTG
ncbi:hypothetical protein [Tropicibacter sp. Alg240-R139]|uniref:hypothetical protein n=1 Tax=Tropicibacter sp. Alg240-R139 TaxID=2305991 RepID=UPI001967931E|nr:hypothetical protein [Tropicibacter sp. Alg240-R139]